MTETSVVFEQDGDLARITLARPLRANAVDLETAAQFGAAVTAAAHPSVKAIVLRGAGSRFCAGGDVVAMAAHTDRASYVHELATILERHLRRLSESAKPVVTGVQGAVAGAGLAFVLNSDIVIAARSTSFVVAYGGIGLTPDCGVSYLLARAIGQQRALALALTDRVFTADEAERWGLIAEVADDAVLDARVETVSRVMAARSGFASGHAKRLIRHSWAVDRVASAVDEADTIRAAMRTEHASARIDALLADWGRRSVR